MASKNVCCSIPTAILSAVTELRPCPTDIGQVQNLIFWRAGNSIASEATALISTTWVTLLTATDSTKAVVTPLIDNPVFEGGEAREFGGGNETRNGKPHIKGGEPTLFSASIHKSSQDVIRTIKGWSCEDLEVLFLCEGNQLFYRQDGDLVKGFPIRSLFVSSLIPGGMINSDTNNLSFYLSPNWSDYGVLSTNSKSFDMLGIGLGLPFGGGDDWAAYWAAQGISMKLDSREDSTLTDSIGTSTGTILTPVFLQAATSSAYVGGNLGQLERFLDGGNYTVHCKLKHMGNFPASSLTVLQLGSDGLVSRRGICFQHRSNNRLRLMVADGTTVDDEYMTAYDHTANGDLSGAGIIDLLIQVDFTAKTVTGQLYDSEGTQIGVTATVDVSSYVFNDNNNFSSIRFNSKYIAFENFKKFSGLKTLEQCKTDSYNTDLQIHLPNILSGVDHSTNAVDFIREASISSDDIVYASIDTWSHDYGYDLYQIGDPDSGGIKVTVPRKINGDSVTINRGAGSPTIGFKIIAENDGAGACNTKDAKIRFSDSFFDRSNDTIWAAAARSASDYDASNTKDFHMDNLNQRTLMSWLNTGYKGRLYIKWTDNSIEKWDRKYLQEVILTDTDIKGADQIKAFTYTGDVFAAVKSGGSYSYDGDGYAQLGYLKSTRPMITFRFDDGYDSQYDSWWPFLQAQSIGGKATVGIHCNLIGTVTDPTTMSWTKLQALNAAGWDIACHNPTDSNFTGSSPSTSAILDQIETLLLEGIADQEAHGLACNYYIGNRYSMQNPSVPYYVHKVGMQCALAWGGTEFDGVKPQGANPAALDLFNLYAINSDILVDTPEASDLFYLKQTPNATQIQNTKDEIDDAVTNNKWIIFMLHSYSPTVATALNEIIDYAQTKDLDFVNISDALDKMEYI